MTQGVIKRLGLKPSASTQHDDVDSEMDPTSIPEDYKALITDCFQMMGLPADQITISVRPVGLRPCGLEVYAAFVKVMHWDASVASMLTKMPLIERRIDRLVRKSSMSRYSSFAGLWFRSPPALDEFAIKMH